MIGIGGDLGLVRDASAFCAVRADTDTFVLLQLLELRPTREKPLKLSEVCAEASTFARRYGSHTILVDHHMIEPAKEHMTAGVHLRACEGGQQPKIDSYTHVKDLLASRRIRIPGCYHRLKHQLREVVAKPTSGGGLSISSPRRGGAHGDLVSAFVLAVWAAKAPSFDLGKWMEAEGYGSSPEPGDITPAYRDPVLDARAKEKLRHHNQLTRKV